MSIFVAGLTENDKAIVDSEWLPPLWYLSLPALRERVVIYRDELNVPKVCHGTLLVVLCGWVYYIKPR
jgi:hypothetical protein